MNTKWIYASLGIAAVALMVGKTQTSRRNIDEPAALQKVRTLVNQPLTQAEKSALNAKLSPPIRQARENLEKAQVEYRQSYEHYQTLEGRLNLLARGSDGKNSPELIQLSKEVDRALQVLAAQSTQVAKQTAEMNRKLLAEAQKFL